MTIPDEAVQAAKDVMYYANPNDVERALTAAAPFLQGVKMKDLSALERLAKLADDYDMPDENGPFPDIQDAMVTVGDLRNVRKIFVELSAIEAAPSPRAHALEEAAKVVERRIRISPSNTKAFRAYQDACRHILGDLRALSSQPVADGWLPIESAPKDGTEFIGWDGKWPFRCSAGKKYELYPHMDGGPTYRDVWDGHYYDSLTIEHPTHWRPLPASPGASE